MASSKSRRLKSTLKKKQKKYNALMKQKRALFVKAEKVGEQCEMLAEDIEEIEYELHELKA